jgi:hypothetical protein
MLVCGIGIYRDYGLSFDEPLQRYHSLVNYRYISQVLFHRSIPELENVPELATYQYNSYGVAIQLPLVAVEDLYHFQLNTQQVYYLHHLYTFLLFFCSLVCFYGIGRRLFKNTWIALGGTALLWLYPRFFAESFYNIKDLVFVSFYIITLFMLLQVLQSGRKTLWCILFSLICAITINIRIMGVMLLLILPAFMLAEDGIRWLRVKHHPSLNPTPHKNEVHFGAIFRRILPYFIIVAGTAIAYIVFTPIAWQQPFEYFKHSFALFANYEVFNYKILFAGRFITTAQAPWYYIPVWMGLTIPFVYMLLFIIGNIVFLFNLIKYHKGTFTELEYIFLFIILYFVPLLVIIILKVKVYNGWRHVYFLLVPFILIAMYGLSSLFRHQRSRCLKYIAVALVTGTLVCQAGWIIHNHPHEYVYFNLLGRPFASQFERDYWHVSQNELYRYILNKYNPTQVTIYSLMINRTELLDPVQQAKIVRLKQEEYLTQSTPADFILEMYWDVAGNTAQHAGYTEDYAIWVDGFKIASVFRNNSFQTSSQRGIIAE